MKFAIYNKKLKKYVKNEPYGDEYELSLDGKVVKYEYSDRYGHRKVYVNQDDFIIEMIVEEKK